MKRLILALCLLLGSTSSIAGKIDYGQVERLGPV